MSDSLNCAISAETGGVSCHSVFATQDYDLAATLGCGQAFRWEWRGTGWQGVIGTSWVELRQHGKFIHAHTALPQGDWNWLEHYLQLDVRLDSIIATFPDDPPLRQAVAACKGLRLLRQPMWECLASFILSSTKQIVQIRQIVAELSKRYGAALPVPHGNPPVFSFPSAEMIATLSEPDLRNCRMGFRAPYLLAAARAVVARELDLTTLPAQQIEVARAHLLKLPGVGPKIADCVLLFAGGFPTAFPVDIWIMKALRQSYFRNRRVSLVRLRRFSETHFGPHGGYAQQYLFHWLRMKEGKGLSR